MTLIRCDTNDTICLVCSIEHQKTTKMDLRSSISSIFNLNGDTNNNNSNNNGGNQNDSILSNLPALVSSLPSLSVLQSTSNKGKYEKVDTNSSPPNTNDRIINMNNSSRTTGQNGNMTDESSLSDEIDLAPLDDYNPSTSQSNRLIMTQNVHKNNDSNLERTVTNQANKIASDPRLLQYTSQIHRERHEQDFVLGDMEKSLIRLKEMSGNINTEIKEQQELCFFVYFVFCFFVFFVIVIC